MKGLNEISIDKINENIIKVPIEQKPIILTESKRKNYIYYYSKTQFFIHMFVYLYCLGIFLMLTI